jgi:RNA polymerase sigma factor (sigma-70 family)
MKEDATLLRQFVEERSEAAFSEIVQRHVNLVYSVAVRQLAGDVHRAEDAAQAVFCELARKAHRLLHYRDLGGWLYNTTRFLASRLQRGEQRRAVRELTFAMNETESSSPSLALWRDIETLLDDAMQELSAKDREAVVLRYFQNKPLAEIGAAVGAGENAARMRVDRALEKLRKVLARRGIKSSSALIGAALAANAVTSAPVGLAATLSGMAIAANVAAASVTGSFNLIYLMASTKLKTVVATLALSGMTTAYLITNHTAKSLRSEMANLKQAASEAEELRLENSRLGRLKSEPGELARLREEHSELLRLRGEVTQLRKQQRETAAVISTSADRASNQAAPAITEQQQQEVIKTLSLAKMNLTRFWGAAFLMSAEANEGKFPATFNEASKFLPPIPEEADWINGMASVSDFEIVFEGSLAEIENPQTIVLREKEPFDIQASGAARRTYLFADGHSEVHLAPDGNFEPWEQARRARLQKTKPTKSVGGL